MDDTTRQMGDAQPAQPSLPMTGSGRRSLPTQNSGSSTFEDMGGGYVPPARQGDVALEAQGTHPITTLRRTIDDGFGRRRI